MYDLLVDTRRQRIKKYVMNNYIQVNKLPNEQVGLRMIEPITKNITDIFF